jgi:cytochrome c biogenesis protein CcmG/thiol:disulfide interchange protein DsbE
VGILIPEPVHPMKNQILSLLFTISTSHAQLAKGSTFPNPKSFGVTGEMPATNGKVVLYDFWASWCAPCRQAFPAYEKLYQKYKKNGLIVVGVGTDKKPTDSEKFLKGLKTTFPVVFDHTQKIVAKVRSKGMPTAYLVGKNGRIIHIHTGFRGNKTIKNLEAQIAAALK